MYKLTLTDAEGHLIGIYSVTLKAETKDAHYLNRVYGCEDLTGEIRQDIVAWERQNNAKANS